MNTFYVERVEDTKEEGIFCVNVRKLLVPGYTLCSECERSDTIVGEICENHPSAELIGVSDVSLKCEVLITKNNGEWVLLSESPEWLREEFFAKTSIQEGVEWKLSLRPARPSAGV